MVIESRTGVRKFVRTHSSPFSVETRSVAGNAVSLAVLRAFALTVVFFKRSGRYVYSVPTTQHDNLKWRVLGLTDADLCKLILMIY